MCACAICSAMTDSIEIARLDLIELIETYEAYCEMVKGESLHPGGPLAAEELAFIQRMYQLAGGKTKPERNNDE